MADVVKLQAPLRKTTSVAIHHLGRLAPAVLLWGRQDEPPDSRSRPVHTTRRSRRMRKAVTNIKVWESAATPGVVTAPVGVHGPDAASPPWVVSATNIWSLPSPFMTKIWVKIAGRCKGESAPRHIEAAPWR